MGDLFMNLDLNLEPVFDPSSPPSSPAICAQGFGSFSHEHQIPQPPIEDRIRFAIRVSDRQHQTSMTSAIEQGVGLNIERLKNQKMDVTHLAKALEMDVESNITDGVLFDCNICLGLAKDPILTCCGHLFCWGCFYQVSYVDSVSKECPVCNGEVTDSNVTPVYGSGNGKSSRGVESSFGMWVPPRPQAHRVDSVGQQRSLVHNAVVDAVGTVGSSEVTSIVHASVDIRSGNRRYGGLTAYGDVEIDRDLSSSSRRRPRLR